MLRLKCLGCGLTTPYRGSKGELCPRCLARERKAIRLIPVGDEAPSARSQNALQLETLVEGDRHTIVLCGELEIASAATLEAAVADACATGAKEIVLEMAGIEFMDSMGLNAIIRGRERCQECDCALTLTPAQRPVHRVLEATRVAERISGPATQAEHHRSIRRLDP
jgi:anti-anti-sigma factor